MSARGGWPSGFQNQREPTKSNARCWTPPAAALLIAVLLLVGCETVSSDATTVRPPIVEYRAPDQARAAIEIEAFPEGSMVGVMPKSWRR